MSHMSDCHCDQCLLAMMTATGAQLRQQGWQIWYERDRVALQRAIDRQCKALGCSLYSEDILQDAFVIGFRNISRGEFRDQGKALRAYLHGIARKLVYKVAYLQHKEPSYKADFDVEVEEIISPEDRIYVEHLLTSVGEACRQLPGPYCRVLKGLYAQEKNSQELSTELGKSPTNIRAIAHRAVQSIDQYLVDRQGLQLSTDAIRLCLKML